MYASSHQMRTVLNKNKTMFVRMRLSFNKTIYRKTYKILSFKYILHFGKWLVYINAYFCLYVRGTIQYII